MMLAPCLLLLVSSCAAEYTFQSEHLSELLKPKLQKSVKTYYYAKKVPPYQMHYETRMQYPVKVPYRRPYTVYVPKPYLVEVPKPVQYVKVPLSQQYHYEKHVPYTYKIAEKPSLLHQTMPVYFEQKFPTSLDGKVPMEVKVPFENQVSVSVDKPVLLPVNFGVEKPIEEKPDESIGGYVSLPEEVTPQFEVSVKKENALFPSFEKELMAEQLKGGSGFSYDGFSSNLVSQGKPKQISLPSEFTQSLSSENGKIVLEPIVVSEDPKKWSNFNVSGWVPHYDISNIKTISANKYNLIKPEKQKFEISEVKVPFQGTQISEDLSKYQPTDKNSFVPSPTLETITYQKQVPFVQKVHNEQLNQPIESPSLNNFQFYNIQSGSILKPEALTSSVTYKVESDQKSSIEPPHQWIISQEKFATRNEPPRKWVNNQDRYTVRSEPTKWVKNQAEYITKTDATKNRAKTQEQYTIQQEPEQQWLKGQEQYITQNTSTQQWINNQGISQGEYITQKEPPKRWAKTQEQYIIQKEVPQQWLSTQKQRITQKHTQPQFLVKEEQSKEVKTKQEAEVQSSNLVAHSSQQFSMSPQYEIYTENSQQSQPKEFSHQDNHYYQLTQTQDNSFKPLIPENNQVSNREHIQLTDTTDQFSHGNFPQLQNYQHKTVQQQNPVQQSTTRNPQQQHRHVHHSLSSPEPVYQSTQSSIQQEQKLPTSQINYQQFFPEPTQYQPQKQEAIQQSQTHFSVQDVQVQPQYQQFIPEPQQYHTSTQSQEYWQHKPEQSFQQQPLAGSHPEATSVPDSYEDRGKQRHQEDGYYGQKRRQRQPNKGETVIADQLIRSTRLPATTITEEPATTTVPSTTTTHPRRKQRRKSKRRNNHETTTVISTQ